MDIPGSPEKLIGRPEKMADEVALKVVEMLGKTKPIQKIRNSQIVTAVLGAAGLALFLVGVEKIFTKLSGWASVIMGMILLTISGALLRKLK